MKNEYDYLNEIIVDFSRYEIIKLDERVLNEMKIIICKFNCREGNIWRR